jgi:small conductance mechanosensitive channel
MKNLDYINIYKDLLHIALILLIAWVLLHVSRKLIRLFQNYMGTRSHSAEDRRRIETLARVFRYLSTVIISLVAGMLTLSELGISIAPILGAAGVVGLAVGFGAQSLIKDYFTGFFLLLENQIRQGDVVEVCGKTGCVEDLTLRYVCLRDFEGSVHYIPNGQITLVTNRSRDYAFAVADISVSYQENLPKVYAVIEAVGLALQNDPLWRDKILEAIEIQGVQSFADSAVVIRCRIKTEALEQGNVHRAFLGAVKEAFDEQKIEMPYPQLMIHQSK